jgi:aryl-alcohol dehydrogenase-like predicted oxidoreductase
MEYTTFPGIDRKVSRFIIGTASIMLKDDNSQDFDRLDAALELGINVLDTALSYGRDTTEVALGKYFKERGRRKDFVLITKGCHPNFYRKRVTPYDLESDLNDSLAKLGTDYIDLYLLHRDDPEVPVGPLMETLDRYRREGKILAYGVSNWTTARIEEANQYAKEHNLAPIVVSSPNYSLAQQYREPWAPGCITISGPENESERAWYKKTQMPVLAYSSMARGLFSGRITRELFEKDPGSIDEVCANAYCGPENFTRLERCTELAKEKGCTIPQVAMAFILNSGMNVFPIIGAENREEMLSSIGALDVKLTQAEVDWLDLKRDSR